MRSMRKVALGMHIKLDGSLAGPKGLGWSSHDGAALFISAEALHATRGGTA